MRGLTLILFLGAALVVELTWGWIFSGSGVRLPFLPFALIVLFWHGSFEKRILLAFGAGLFLDALSPFPFGVYLFSLVAVASATEFWRTIFSHTKSLLSQGIGAALSLTLFYAILIGAGSLFAPGGNSLRETASAAAGVLGQAAAWIFLLPLLYFYTWYTIRRVSL